MNCSNRSELCSMYFKNNFSFSFFSCMQTTKNGRICSRIKVVYSSFELFWYFFHSEWFRMCSVKLCNLLNSMKMFDLCKSFHGTPADAFISIKNNDLRMCFVPHLQTFRVYLHCIWTISGLVFFLFRVSNEWYYTLLSISNWSNKSFSSFCSKRWSDRTDFHLCKVHFFVRRSNWILNSLTCVQYA